ncbi:MAG: cytochrome b [Parvibaculum sp.]|uniref:cytochrome b n=1 Tax=Parvibaculum sp. TaxID=2024848 RepID=UPI002ABC7C8E|nr:cytochrome b [Parvibaculum sp.]MDZ4382274.1 cytochrome b [Parvibaculum sp.]
MQWRNSDIRFGLAAVSLHWLVAALFLFMLALGVWMTRLPLTDPWTFPAYQLHKSIGATIFLLVCARIAWRAANAPPPLPAALKLYERALARATHWGLYAALVLMPLTGWTIVSASPLGFPTVLYGLVPLPHIGFVADHPQKAAIGTAASWAHWTIAIAAAGLVALHIGAALWHHFARRDDVLTRMLPSRVLFRKGNGT